LRIIAYERVSTARQGASGLGLEAQRQAIEAHAGQRGATIIARFTEIESGRNPDRPELGRALHLAKVTGATMVIAKLDRLSRNAAFLLTLRDSGVRFAAVDLTEANDLTVGIMALVAQQEREAISRRTREALAVAKARGVKLGNPNGAAALRRAGKGGAPLRAAIGRNADAHARDLAPVVADIRGCGATSLRAIADELNARGMLTRRGGHWHVSTVMNLLGRLGAADVRQRGMMLQAEDLTRSRMA
jgi:DNA invertase Pin-like site-specific DNA recombinase